MDTAAQALGRLDRSEIRTVVAVLLTLRIGPAETADPMLVPFLWDRPLLLAAGMLHVDVAIADYKQRRYDDFRFHTGVAETVFEAADLPRAGTGEAIDGRTLVLLFTDGLDTTSWLSPLTVIEEARRSDVVVDAVRLDPVADPMTDFRRRSRLPPPPSGQVRRWFLEEPQLFRHEFLSALTDETGGQLIVAGSSGNLRDVFVEDRVGIQDALRAHVLADQRRTVRLAPDRGASEEQEGRRARPPRIHTMTSASQRTRRTLKLVCLALTAATVSAQNALATRANVPDLTAATTSSQPQ